MLGEGLARILLDRAVALYDFPAEIGQARMTAALAAGLSGDDGLAEPLIQLGDQQPSAPIGHIHHPRRLGDRSVTVDELEKLYLPGAEPDSVGYTAYEEPHPSTPSAEFTRDQDCAEIIHIGAGRSGDDEIPELFEELVGIVVIKHLLRMEIQRSRAVERGRIDQRACIVLCPVDPVGVAGDRVYSRGSIEGQSQGERE